MSKQKELIVIRDKYSEEFRKLAIKFHGETGLTISDISFGYPLKLGDSDLEERRIQQANVRIGIDIP